MKYILILFAALLALSSVVLAVNTGMTSIVLSPTIQANDSTMWSTLQNTSHYVDYLKWPGRPYNRGLILGFVTLSVGTNATITIKKGSPVYVTSGLGNLTLPIKNGTELIWIGPLESARFKNETGYLNVCGHNVSGMVAALEVPT
jgi:hypothetical protein